MPKPVKPLISVVDDDASVRRSLQRTLRLAGYDVELFDTAKGFLSSNRRPNCLLLDVGLPGMSGLDLQDELVMGKLNVPIVFITGNGNVPVTVRAIKAGAVDFLEKPFDEAELLGAICRAIGLDCVLREKEKAISQERNRLSSLTSREHEVMTFVISGLTNKGIAAELGASEKTIKIHRGRLMRKLEVDSVVALVRLAESAGIQPALVEV